MNQVAREFRSTTKLNLTTARARNSSRFELKQREYWAGGASATSTIAAMAGTHHQTKEVM